MLRNPSPPTPVLVYGNILHEVFQRCLRSNRWGSKWIGEQVDEVLGDSLGELVRVGVGIETARREILLRAKGVETFGNRYMSDKPKVRVSSSSICLLHSDDLRCSAGSYLDQHSGPARRSFVSRDFSLARCRRRYMVPDVRTERKTRCFRARHNHHEEPSVSYPYNPVTVWRATATLSPAAS